MKLRYKYWTKSKGIGGFLQKPEDFAVREVIDPRFLRKFGADKRKYTLFLVKKRNTTTHQMIKKLASLGFGDIGYAGLKDKFSVSWQYITALAEDKIYKLDGIEVVAIGRSKKLFPGDLIGNEFIITLHGCKNKRRLYSIVEEVYRKGLPNYFDLQRFGKNRDNHIVGKSLIKRGFSHALKVINKNSKKKYRSIKEVPKSLLKFFVNAYQSWIFNEVLNEYMGKNKKPYFMDACIIGYNTSLGKSLMDRITKSICKKESIKTKNFRIDELRMSCLGGKRKAFIRLSKIDYFIGANVKLSFSLPKGSYATVLLREICKNKK